MGSHFQHLVDAFLIHIGADVISEALAVLILGNGRHKKGRTVQVPRKIDFVANSGGKRTYIQSAYALHDEAKAETESRPFALTGDSFPKIIVRHDIRKRWYDDNGVLNIGVIDFLLDESIV